MANAVLPYLVTAFPLAFLRRWPFMVVCQSRPARFCLTAGVISKGGVITFLIWKPHLKIAFI